MGSLERPGPFDVVIPRNSALRFKFQWTAYDTLTEAQVPVPLLDVSDDPLYALRMWVRPPGEGSTPIYFQVASEGGSGTVGRVTWEPDGDEGYIFIEVPASVINELEPGLYAYDVRIWEVGDEDYTARFLLKGKFTIETHTTD